jgi:AGZA family xanthine/uracil permease-like MFS transporter
MFVTAFFYYIIVREVPSFDYAQVGQSFRDFAEVGIFGVFTAGSWHAAFSPELVGGVLVGIMLVVAFCLVDMFDTIGTLYGTASEADMLDENGDPINLNQCMMADSTATVVGAMLGTSTCTTFVESATGVSAGGRTGLTSVIVAICFFLCLYLTPLASVVPACATSPALVYVGVLMLGNVKKIDMTDLASSAVGFMTIISMLLTYSIANGIGIGAITYTAITIFTGKYKSKDIMVTIIALLFILKFCMITM